MANLDTTALAAVLKQQYTQSKVYDIVYDNHPFWAMIKKKTNFFGSNKVVAIRSATPQGRSHTFASGQTNAKPSIYNKFTVTRNVGDYAFADITGEAILASKSDAGALVEGLKNEVDGAILTAGRNIALELFKNGGGSRGQISAGSNTATATITLTNINDIVGFEVGQVLQTSTADGTTGSVKSGTVTVAGVDRDLGTVTASGNWTSGIGTAAASDYIFQSGDFGLGMKGLPAWLPVVAPVVGGGDSFFGLDRASDVTRYAGLRYNGAGAPTEETLITAAARLAREGGRPDVCIMNPIDQANLVKALGSKVIYDRMTVAGTSKPDFGFQAVQLIGPTGPIKCFADLNCPSGIMYLLQLNTWSYESLSQAPMILDLDGMPFLRSDTQDAYRVRVGYYGQLICEAPGYNCVVTL